MPLLLGISSLTERQVSFVSPDALIVRVEGTSSLSMTWQSGESARSSIRRLPGHARLVETLEPYVVAIQNQNGKLEDIAKAVSGATTGVLCVDVLRVALTRRCAAQLIWTICLVTFVRFAFAIRATRRQLCRRLCRRRFWLASPTPTTASGTKRSLKHNSGTFMCRLGSIETISCLQRHWWRWKRNSSEQTELQRTSQQSSFIAQQCAHYRTNCFHNCMRACAGLSSNNSTQIAKMIAAGALTLLLSVYVAARTPPTIQKQFNSNFNIIFDKY